ncbi:MAG: hypothetical protein PUI64_10610 [Treponema succinifaciens]|uniref:hypothetical protein n=1 Tax=Treponema TaxID=157 RepID=UPI0023F36873|nr:MULTISPECIES: hypothetical protein [Treponema]MDD6963329.1 hypothetical protein [Treponema succinifaciens]MDY5118235.1 hypothetical protein [Treponema succinifaciens]
MSSIPVFLQGEKIFLDSRMSGNVFVKAGFAGKIRENGLLAELNGETWNFSLWSFESTLSSADLKEFAQDKDETVFLEGSCFYGFVLSEYLESLEKEESIKACSLVCNALDALDESKSALSLVGAGGIIVSKDFSKVLFLPKNLIEISLSSLGEENFSDLYGSYLNPVFSGKTAVRFLQAVIVYKAICGKFPFAEKNASSREVDIRDLNYCPLRYAVFGVDEKILLFTENAFAGKDCLFPKEEFSALELKEPSSSDLEKFKAESQKFLLSQEKRIRAKRWLRAKSTVIKICAAVFIFAIAAVVSLYRTFLEKRTTKGLTSLQTVEMYYSAVNLLDVDSARASSAKSLGGRVDRLANIFVTGKTSSMYNAGNDLVPPSVWLVKNQLSHNIYGISNFTVDGSPCRTFFNGQRRKENPVAIFEENGQKIFLGETKEYQVEFFIFDSLGEDSLCVSLQKEKVSLEFKKDRWIITGIQTEIESRFLKFSELKTEYSAAMENCGGDVFACASVLRQKYDFIPTDQEITDAEKYVEEQSLVFLKPAAE